MFRLIKGCSVIGDEITLNFLIKFSKQFGKTNFVVLIVERNLVFVKEWAKKIIIYAINKLYRQNLI
ncbi:hypothetical protein CMESO_496 (nucleomorph) [Chroomonas mesostigmatica CCMP1168]|uniref:Uncharacterized protein n=1 Tax=Chroomonas mesostigmatica CCMP1168 TaxID=1195612 RepID=J7GB52_9CRYP|nr:hypothetical protein CMESO_496 [Chroomonas mesostigmatica CCMP1168]